MLMLVTAINDVHQYLKNELVNRQLKAENWQPNIPDKTYEVIFFSYRAHGNLTPFNSFPKGLCGLPGPSFKSAALDDHFICFRIL